MEHKINNKNIILKMTARICLALVIVQSLIILAEEITFRFIKKTIFTRSMIVMIMMIIFTAAILLWTKFKTESLAIFPVKFSKSYLIATIITIIIYVLTPSNYTGGIKPIIMLFYGSIVTPIFEEILFRGCIWQKLQKCFNKEKAVYAISTILFALFHIGYAISLNLWMGGNLWMGMFMKVTLALIYGIILGALRYKTKNCYIGILVHGIINAMAR